MAKKLDFIAEEILKEWERAGGEFAIVARAIRAVLEREEAE